MKHLTEVDTVPAGAKMIYEHNVQNSIIEFWQHDNDVYLKHTPKKSVESFMPDNYSDPFILKCDDRGLLYDVLSGIQHMQTIFPDDEAGHREFLISGIAPKVWDAMFPKEDEQDHDYDDDKPAF